MKKSMRFLGLLMVLCMLFTAMTASAADDHIDAGDMTEVNRRPVLVLTPGSGQGQVGYGGSEQFGYEGPESFAVVDGVIYILDSINDRILIWNGSSYRSISISACPNATHMKVQDQKIGVVDNDANMTAIYSLDGTLITYAEHPQVIKDEWVYALVEIGDSHIIWETYEKNYYQYNWNSGITEATDFQLELIRDDSNMASVCGMGNTGTWTVNAENRDIDVLGISGNELVYYQCEYVPDIDIFLLEFSVRKVNRQGEESYAFIDFSEWHAHPLEPVYLAADGKIYIMECLEDCTVISEVILGTTGQSRMHELEAIAEARRSERELLNQMENAGESFLNIDRTQVFVRASQMANLRWTVKDVHKVAPNSNIRIPISVLNTATGTSYIGIPYCWGGANGIDTRKMGPSFYSLAETGEYVTGNLGETVESRAIGLDCSGFVASAYMFSGDKKGTEYFMDYGHSIDKTRLKSMDFIVYRIEFADGSAEGHVMLYHQQGNGTNIVVYESYQFGTNNNDGKVVRRERPWSDLENVEKPYQARTPFHLTCDRNGQPLIDAYSHYCVCSECDYRWPRQDHQFINGVCMVCDYVQ